MIQPTTIFGRPQRHVKEILTVEPSPFTLQSTGDDMSIQAACTTYTMPSCLRVLYNIGNTTADPNVKTILGISGFLEVSSTTPVNPYMYM
jgi:tripeptidyl-peptidase I